MATDRQFSWPSVGSSVAAYGQFFMAANTGQLGGSNDRTTALMVIIIAAVGFVVLGVVFAVMLFKRRSKQ